MLEPDDDKLLPLLVQVENFVQQDVIADSSFAHLNERRLVVANRLGELMGAVTELFEDNPPQLVPSYINTLLTAKVLATLCLTLVNTHIATSPRSVSGTIQHKQMMENAAKMKEANEASLPRFKNHFGITDWQKLCLSGPAQQQRDAILAVSKRAKERLKTSVAALHA